MLFHRHTSFNAIQMGIAASMKKGKPISYQQWNDNKNAQ